MDSPIYEVLFKTKTEYITRVAENLTHLPNTINNILVYNAPASTFKGLLLNKNPEKDF